MQTSVAEMKHFFLDSLDHKSCGSYPVELMNICKAQYEVLMYFYMAANQGKQEKPLHFNFRARQGERVGRIE